MPDRGVPEQSALVRCLTPSHFLIGSFRDEAPLDSLSEAEPVDLFLGQVLG